MAFDLSSIQKGKQPKPPLILLYGVHGIGKSTFGADAPNPVFIQTEDGLGSLDVAKFPLAKTSADVIEALGTLYSDKHDYKTCVLDSADWLDNFLTDEINKEYSAQDLAYGKNALILHQKWAMLLDGFKALRDDRGMNVILIAHSEIARFDAPDTEAYDRYQPKMNKKSSALVQEWADAVLFCNYQTLIKKEDAGFNKKNVRGISTGERLIHTEETAAYKAKNRYALPPTMKLSWDAFYTAYLAACKQA
jgi:hypothetical protein